MGSVVVGLLVDGFQGDEILSLVGCKEQTWLRSNYAESFGEAYCFTALERTTTMISAWHLGKRDCDGTLLFAEKLARPTSGRFQHTVDGLTPHEKAIPQALGARRSR